MRLRSPDPAAASPGPTIVQRTDQNFLPSLLEELAGSEWLAAIRGQVARTHDAGGVLTLFQPVHRTFHVVLLEVVCDTVGSPRLDPARIESAGLVLRRRAGSNGNGTVRPTVLEAWMQDAGKPGAGGAGATRPRALRGWIELSAWDLDRDPDPGRRPPPLRSGHPEIDRRLMLARPLGESLAESVSPLFVAPPEVCAVLGKTILYGLVPVTSPELSEAPAVFPQFDLAAVRAHMPQLLQSGLTPKVPHAGGLLAPSAVNDAERSGDPPELVKFVAQLRQIAVEFGAFGDGPAAQALYRELNAIALPFPHGGHRPAGEFLRDAAGVLLAADDRGAQPASAVRMPVKWPAIPAPQAQRFVQAAQAALSERLRLVTPHVGRFAGPSREYRLRAFVRVKSHEGCPHQLVWSDHSDPFTIAPWYAASDAPPVQITLPDAHDRGFLKQLKPNVAFVLPKPLFKLVQCSDPKDLMKGSAGAEDCTGGMDLDWICGFNIPIITLCAFIVLNIFLQLFNLIFMWLPFVKICVPLPRRSSP